AAVRRAGPRRAQTGRGGRAFFFQACLPSSGPGALAPREDMKALGTDRERQFFLSQDDYYKKVRTRTGPVPCVSHAARRLTRPGLRSSRAWLRLCYCQMAIEFAAQGICTEV